MIGYDRVATGLRIRERRELVGMTRKQLAQQLDRTELFCEEVEKGNKVVSVETLLEIARLLHLSLDYMLLGQECAGKGEKRSEKLERILALAQTCPEEKLDYLEQLIQIFLMAQLPSGKGVRERES